MRTIMGKNTVRSEEHTSELQSLTNLVCRLLLEKKKYGGEVCGTACGAGTGSTERSVVFPDALVAESRRIGQGDSPGVVARHIFFNDTATTEIYTLSLHDALPI